MNESVIRIYDMGERANRQKDAFEDIEGLSNALLSRDGLSERYSANIFLSRTEEET